uniref:Uncharacterized protein n=1 Tax=Mycena chlorophos TaxID=658473 RepID=A0ABQ0M7K2_MYCCL|nr:predicted protein [Mycena chlorophos]
MSTSTAAHGHELPSNDEMNRDAQFLAQTFLPDSAPTRPVVPLPLPFCLPQLTSAFGSPFVRAYSPILEDADISQAQLLAFIDGLNAAITASPPLRVVYWTDTWSMWTGLFLQVAAQSGNRILSKSLTDRYLRAANKLLFNPRGLSVRLYAPSAIQHVILEQPEPPRLSRLDQIGRAAGTALLTELPRFSFLSKIVHRAAKQPPRVDATPDLANLPFKAKLLPTMRRLVQLEGHALLPLQFDVPPPVYPDGVRNLVQSWGVRFDRWLYGRSQKRAETQRAKLSDLEQRELFGAPWECDPRLQTKKGMKKKEKLERQVSDADLLEHWESEKILWVVITSSANDERIDGIELADADADEERIDAATWEAHFDKQSEEQLEGASLRWRGHDSDRPPVHY